MAHTSHISQWHFFISGYTQNRQQSTGLQKAWLQTKTSAYKSNPINTQSICFFPVLPWNYDWYTLARFVQINSQEYKSIKGGGRLALPPPLSPLINIYAYSWGAGYGAIRLTQFLLSVANYNVQNMVLADPVYCSSYFFNRWRAMFSSRFSFTRWFAPQITIPSNVLSVFWSRQYNNWPRAHSLVSYPDSKTVIHSPYLEHSLTHSEMDESIWFQNKIKQITNPLELELEL